MKTILIIDDDEDFLEWIAMGLARDGYAILTATTGSEGMELLRDNRPAAAIVDVSLPDIDGFEVCRRVKSDSATAGIPIILVTGVCKEVEFKEKGYGLGADDFLTKPFSYAQLSIRVLHQIRSDGQAGKGK